MANQIQICNLALAQIGKGPIQSIDGTDQQSLICKAVYDLTLQALLTQYEWNFATKTDALSAVDYDYEDYDYAYAYPADCLSAREIVNTASDDKIEFRVILSDDATQRIILTNEEDAVLRYTANVTTPGLYSAPFVVALATKLAMAVCPMLISGSDPTKVQQLQTYYQRIALPEALQADANEGALDPIKDNAIIEARE